MRHLGHFFILCNSSRPYVCPQKTQQAQLMMIYIRTLSFCLCSLLFH